MANTSYLLMQEFAAEAIRSGKTGDFERKAVFDNAENLVNNVMHGRPFAEVSSRVRQALETNSTRSILTEHARVCYAEAIELLDLFIAVSE